MFSALHQGSPLYILRKGDTPKLETAQVVSLSQPTAYQPMAFGHTLMTIQAKVGEQTYNFEKIDGSLSVVNDGQGTVISETRELMAQEVEAMVSASRQAIESIEHHKRVVEMGESILQELNPRLKKEAEQEERLVALEGKIEQLLNALQKN